MKRLIVIALSLCLIAAAAVGCAKKNKAPATPPAAETTPVETPAAPVARVVAEPNPAAPPNLETIYFDFDASLLTPAAREALLENSRWIQAHPTARVVLEGHADERGSDSYNLALGERRAQAARNYLAPLVQSPERLTVVSYGEERPADPASGEGAWAKNRRVEFKAAP